MHMKSKVVVVPFVVGCLYFFVTLPLFRHIFSMSGLPLLPWDPAIHAKDGYILFQQLSRFDILSFIATILNLSFWMPLHPLLIALTSAFFGFSTAAYILLNSVVMAAGVVYWVYLVLNAHTPAADPWIERNKISLISIGVLLVGVLTYTNAFLDTHLTIMIESLGAILTLLYVLVIGLTQAYPAYWKHAHVLLLLLFLTKIHYGLFFLIPHLVKMFFEIPLGLSFSEFIKLIKIEYRKKYLLVLSIILISFGVFAILTHGQYVTKGFGFQDGVWALLFVPLLVITGFPKKLLNVEYQSLIKILIIPFGWYYLLPFRHKLRWLFFNVQEEHLSLPGRAVVMFQHLGNYLNLPFWVGVTLFVILLGSAIIILLNRQWRSYGAFILIAVVSQYFFMSYVNGNHGMRFSLMFAVSVYTALGFISVIAGRRFSTVLLLMLCGLIFRNVSMVTPSQFNPYLDGHHQSSQQVAEWFDFSKPGIIYGLGKTMDQATIFYDDLIAQKHPEYSSVFLKREDKKTIANDFGRKGNSQPTQEILRRVNEHDVRQIVLFKSGVESEDIAKIREGIKLAGYEELVAFDQPEVIALSLKK